MDYHYIVIARSNLTARTSNDVNATFLWAKSYPKFKTYDEAIDYAEMAAQENYKESYIIFEPRLEVKAEAPRVKVQPIAR